MKMKAVYILARVKGVIGTSKSHFMFICNEFLVLGLYSNECNIQGHFTQYRFASCQPWAFLFCFVFEDRSSMRRNR
jgi:hypothetical protein